MWWLATNTFVKPRTAHAVSYTGVITILRNVGPCDRTVKVDALLVHPAPFYEQ